MSLRQTLDPRSSLWDLLAYYLHFLRVRRGLSCARVGEFTKAARQTVSHWEAGRLRPAEDQMEALDVEYGTGGLLTLLLHHAKTGHDPDWFKAYVQFEPKAISISYYSALIVPGLLQTTAYARALLVAGQAVQDVEAAVHARVSRQSILERTNPPRLWVLLNQGVLEQPVGGPGVMAEQLARLLAASHLPHVVVRVVPRSAGAHVGLDGSFSIMSMLEGKAAYMEACGGGRLTLDRAEIERFALRFDRIGADALSRHETRGLIAEVMEAMT